MTGFIPALMGLVYLNHLCIRRYFMPPPSDASLAKDLRPFRNRNWRVIYFFCGMNVPVLLYVMYPGLLSWSALPLPDCLRCVGVLVGLAANVLWAFAHRALGGNWAPAGIKIKDGPHLLVTTGPYRQIRHPMYTAMYMLTVSFFLISGSLLVMIPWLHNSLLLARHARREEKALIDKYGESYVEYSRGTGMLFPRILKGAGT